MLKLIELEKKGNEKKKGTMKDEGRARGCDGGEGKKHTHTRTRAQEVDVVCSRNIGQLT